MKVVTLTTLPEMLAQITLIQQLYPKMALEKYESYLQEMTLHNYKQLAVFDAEVCVALTGFWTGIKLWSGKYIEIDNFIVHQKYRKQGLGKLMTDCIEEKAKKVGCTMIVLDAFTGNHNANRFYYNQGYEPRGFHFIKMLDERGLS